MSKLIKVGTHSVCSHFTNSVFIASVPAWTASSDVAHVSTCLPYHSLHPQAFLNHVSSAGKWCLASIAGQTRKAWTWYTGSYCGSTPHIHVLTCTKVVPLYSSKFLQLVALVDSVPVFVCALSESGSEGTQDADLISFHTLWENGSECQIFSRPVDFTKGFSDSVAMWLIYCKRRSLCDHGIFGWIAKKIIMQKITLAVCVPMFVDVKPLWVCTSFSSHCQPIFHLPRMLVLEKP